MPAETPRPDHVVLREAAAILVRDGERYIWQALVVRADAAEARANPAPVTVTPALAVRMASFLRQFLNAFTRDDVRAAEREARAILAEMHATAQPAQAEAAG